MNCPTCPSTVLVMADRSGIEIDYCPECRGVWLDRGELDKIIERSLAAIPQAVPTDAPQRASALPLPAPVQGNDYRHDDDDDDDDDDGRRFQHGDQRYTEHRRGKRKKGFLGDLFDF